MLRGTQAYIQTTVSTIGQGEVLIMLYEGAIKFLNRAKKKIAEKDVGAKGILISKALDIVNELDSSLNMEVGGSLAKNLHNLYMLCSTRLLKANLTMDIAIIDNVIDVMARLRDTYKQILDKPEAKAAASQIEAKLVTRTATQKAVALPKMNQMTATGNQIQMQNAYTHTVITESVTPPQVAAPVAPAPQPQMPHPAPATPVTPITPAAVNFSAPVSMGARRSTAAASYGKIANI